MSTLIYKVPIIHQDLRQEDTIVQIADALGYLNACINDVFHQIDSKVAAQKQHLQSISDRTKVVKNKIEKLRGSKKANKVR